TSSKRTWSPAVSPSDLVAACKRPVLEALFRRFQMRELGGDRAAQSHLGQAFRDFQRCGGRSLADFAVFEALDEHYGRDTGGSGGGGRAGGRGGGGSGWV